MGACSTPGTHSLVRNVGNDFALSLSCASTGEFTKSGARWRRPDRRKCGRLEQSRRTGGKLSEEGPQGEQYGISIFTQGGKGVARIGIFTTASSDPVGAADYYVDMFVRVYGAASATHIPVTQFSNNANDPAIVELVNQQTGFFFGGGDQMRIIRALRPNGRDTLVLTAVKNVLAAGGVVGGTSAGTACQVLNFTIFHSKLSSKQFSDWLCNDHRRNKLECAGVRCLHWRSRPGLPERSFIRR